MKIQFNLFIISLFIVSCEQTVRLSEEDNSWMPYKGNETLVFKSNLRETDTIFVLMKDTLFAYPKAQALGGIKLEELSVFCNHYGRTIQNQGRNYYFFKVQKTKDGQTNLIFDLSTKGAVFYRISPVKIDDLTIARPLTLQTCCAQYNDVYLIEPDDYGKDFYKRNNYVTKLYWSKSEGLIRYDKKDGIYWELIKN